MKTVVVVSGGFDPVHSGHISLFKAAKELGELLIVGMNSDEWLTRKKGKPFMPYHERYSVISSIRYVDIVMKFNDDDDSACDLLERIKKMFYDYHIIFANGGDRNETNNREIHVPGITFRYGVGGEHKMNSSSYILKQWAE
jgi:cytidyltransferase-like protein